MSIGDLWRGLIKRWLVPVSMAELSEIIGRIPEDAKVYRPLAKPASANSSSAGLGTPAQGGTLSGSKAEVWVPSFLVCYRLDERDDIAHRITNYIIDEDSFCGLVNTGAKSIVLIPWDSVLCVQM